MRDLSKDLLLNIRIGGGTKLCLGAFSYGPLSVKFHYSVLHERGGLDLESGSLRASPDLNEHIAMITYRREIKHKRQKLRDVNPAQWPRRRVRAAYPLSFSSYLYIIIRLQKNPSRMRLKVFTSEE